ncbi:IS3 family transposase, partial [Bacillus subtilis]
RTVIEYIHYYNNIRIQTKLNNQSLFKRCFDPCLKNGGQSLSHRFFYWT